MTDWSVQRLNMVESQVRPSDVSDRRVIRAMLAVPREAFVPGHLKSVAYMDDAVPLGQGRGARCLLPPRTFAKLVQAADLSDNATVLDVGCATGYSTAVLARMVKRVVGLESDPALADAARKTLTEQGITNATVITGVLAAGSSTESPFDAIVLNGSVTNVPQSLLDQLKAGGRLIAIVADGPAGKAVVCTRSGTLFDQRDIFDASATPLPGFAKAAVFAL